MWISDEQSGVAFQCGYWSGPLFLSRDCEGLTEMLEKFFEVQLPF